jgi:hypothetical protein
MAASFKPDVVASAVASGARRLPVYQTPEQSRPFTPAANAVRTKLIWAGASSSTLKPWAACALAGA